MEAWMWQGNVGCSAVYFSSPEAAMSGIKRKIEGNDPDYEDILLAQNSKRNKAAEHNGELSGLTQDTCFTLNNSC